MWPRRVRVAARVAVDRSSIDYHDRETWGHFLARLGKAQPEVVPEPLVGVPLLEACTAWRERQFRGTIN